MKLPNCLVYSSELQFGGGGGERAKQQHKDTDKENAVDKVASQV